MDLEGRKGRKNCRRRGKGGCNQDISENLFSIRGESIFIKERKKKERKKDKIYPYVLQKIINSFHDS